MNTQRALSEIPLFRNRPIQISELSGGITNKNYRVSADGSVYVARVSDKSTALLGIRRPDEAAASRAAAKTGVGASVVYFKRNPDILVTRFITGKPVKENEVSRLKTMARIVDSLRRVHKGPRFPGKFSPFETVLRYHREGVKRKSEYPLGFSAHLDTMKVIRRRLKSKKSVPCHNDLLAGNFIDDGRRIRIIDWEYAGMGDLFFDLGNLAANCEFDDASDRRLLKLYFGRVRQEEEARLKLMKAASCMRESSWGFLQAAISKLDFNFKEYGLTHLNRFLECVSDSRFSSWLSAVVKS